MFHKNARHQGQGGILQHVRMALPITNVESNKIDGIIIHSCISWTIDDGRKMITIMVVE